MSVYAQAAEQPKQEETITVVAAPAAQESAWGPAPTIAAKRSATATKTDTPIEKTPQSVSVVTRQEMEMRQPTTVKEALSYTPSVFSTRGSSTTYDVVTIRGFTTSTTVNTNQYLDGMKLQGNNYSEVSMDPYFLERVEVMRGPTSVLYGNSNPGGIVSMVSKRPTTEPLKEVQFKMGTDNLWQTGFDFSDAIDDAGVWSYRLTGLGRDDIFAEARALADTIQGHLTILSDRANVLAIIREDLLLVKDQFAVPRRTLIGEGDAEMEDEDYTGGADAVLLWFRDGDGDLGDALVDMVGVLDDGGFVVLLTPKASAEEVDASDIDEAAVTSGLHPAGTFTASEHWRAHKLVAPKAPAKR